MEGKQTALYEKHVAAGAKLVPFAGYLMPIQYHSITAEHQKVRESVGIFDVSHMGEIWIKGDGALEFINKITVNNPAKLQVNQAQYSAMLYENGGFIDDLIVYRFEDRFMLVVNAANHAKDLAWIEKHAPSNVTIDDASHRMSLLAVQGRNAPAVIQKLTDTNLDDIKFYWFREGEVAGQRAVISATGYTGEAGFELYIDNESAPAVWDAVMEAGAEFGIEPIGLGARDTLRLEMKFALYGNDIDDEHNPLEAGLGWITKVNKGEFIGREAVLAAKEKGLSRKLIGFEVEEKAIPRHGYECYQGDTKIGDVTSGAWSPSLDKGLGLAYLAKEFTAVGTKFELDIRGKRKPARVVETPFYKRPY
ncbi:glycine cleavage system aminomethyltransferase GcvT [bacterium]|nr:glycine cleavage system aminomethyltransferase GcvT [bacterium]